MRKYIVAVMVAAMLVAAVCVAMHISVKYGDPDDILAKWADYEAMAKICPYQER